MHTWAPLSHGESVVPDVQEPPFAAIPAQEIRGAGAYQ